MRIPNGDTPDDIKNHPALAGVDLPRTGKYSHATIVTTKSLFIYGEGRSGAPLLHAVDEKTGEELGTVKIPAPTNTAPMTYMHEGRQYIVLSVAGEGFPAEHVALALPEESLDQPGIRTKSLPGKDRMRRKTSWPSRSPPSFVLPSIERKTFWKTPSTMPT